ncbi:MAG TPA: uroporphyrinogen-III synthase [Anaeromyxobacteraceae bacterium]|jgi:uroporphyrinogen-III synthase/uroporphyrinogen III methyltransferase/synthase|nr:uroporphyrinogen-III synthase [Anaeromyxobacteraceae bacterium]
MAAPPHSPSPCEADGASDGRSSPAARKGPAEGGREPTAAGILPLAGRTVAVTRGKQGEDALAARLRALGAAVLECPAIAAAPPASFAPLDAALRHAGRFQLAVFASANAVAAVSARLAALGLGPAALDGVRLAAVGGATAEKLARALRPADLLPEQQSARGLVTLLAPLVQGWRVLVPRAAEGRPELVEGLVAAGAEVEAPEAYRTVPAGPEALAPLAAALDRGEVDAVAFASPSAVRAVAAALGPRRPLLDRALLAAIGPTTAAALLEQGLAVGAQPGTADGAALAEAIAGALGPRPPG